MSAVVYVVKKVRSKLHELTTLRIAHPSRIPGTNAAAVGISVEEIGIVRLAGKDNTIEPFGDK